MDLPPTSAAACLTVLGVVIAFARWRCSMLRRQKVNSNVLMFNVF